jgi:hypothetical protein
MSIALGDIHVFADYWYIGNLAIIILGFGSIAVLSFIFPVAEFSDRKCRIGLPFKITQPLLVYDIIINLYLFSSKAARLQRTVVVIWR